MSSTTPHEKLVLKCLNCAESFYRYLVELKKQDLPLDLPHIRLPAETAVFDRISYIETHAHLLLNIFNNNNNNGNGNRNNMVSSSSNIRRAATTASNNLTRSVTEKDTASTSSSIQNSTILDHRRGKSTPVETSSSSTARSSSTKTRRSPPSADTPPLANDNILTDKSHILNSEPSQISESSSSSYFYLVKIPSNNSAEAQQDLAVGDEFYCDPNASTASQLQQNSLSSSSNVAIGTNLRTFKLCKIPRECVVFKSTTTTTSAAVEQLKRHQTSKAKSNTPSSSSSNTSTSVAAPFASRKDSKLSSRSMSTMGSDNSSSPALRMGSISEMLSATSVSTGSISSSASSSSSKHKHASSSLSRSTPTSSDPTTTSTPMPTTTNTTSKTPQIRKTSADSNTPRSIPSSISASKISMQSTSSMTIAAFNSVTSADVLKRSKVGGGSVELGLTLNVASEITQKMKEISSSKAASINSKFSKFSMRDFSADDDDNLSLNDHDKNNTNPPSLLSLVQQTTSLIHDLKKDVVSSTPSSSSSSSSSASSESFVNQVLNELISIEESFSRQIKLILDHIVKGVKPTGVEQFEINRMFSGFKELHKHSSAVLASFKGAMEMGYAKMQGKMLEPMYAVASVFAQYVLEFSIYPKYVQNYCHSKKRYQELLQEKAYCEWFKSVTSGPEFGRQSMDHFMLLPIRHVPRYPMLLDRLKRFSSPGNPHHQILDIAHQFVKQLSERMDEAEEEEDNLLRMFEICNNEIENCPMDILSNHRRFVGHFRIEIKEEGTALSSSVVAAAIGRSYTTKSINAFMYLFTDCILITTQSTSKKDAKPYKFLRRLLFKHLTILNKKMDPNTGDILPLLDDLATLASTTTVSESNVTSPTSSSPPLLLRFSYTEPKAEMICVVMAEEKQLNAVCSCVFSYNSGSSSKGSLSSQEEIRRT